jgi:arylsulfatase A-like enzyme
MFMHKQRMIIQGDWKLIFYPFAEKKMRLFHLKRDPLEMEDQIDNPEYATLVRSLRSEFISLQEQMGDTLDMNPPVAPEGQTNQSKQSD